MAKPVATLLFGLALLAAAPACGRKGPLVLPQGRGPNPVEALTAVPAEGAVDLRWTNPVKTVSGRPLGPLAAVEVWIFDRGLPEAGRPLTADRIEKTARLFRRIAAKEFVAFVGAEGETPGVMTFSFPLLPPPETPAKLAFTVRVFDGKGRASEFAPPVAVDLARKDAGVDRRAAEGVS